MAVSPIKQLYSGLQNGLTFKLMSILAADGFKTSKFYRNRVVWLVKRMLNFLHSSVFNVVNWLDFFICHRGRICRLVNISNVIEAIV